MRGPRARGQPNVENPTLIGVVSKLNSQRKSASAQAATLTRSQLSISSELKLIKQAWLGEYSTGLHGTLLKHSRATQHCSLQQVRRLRPPARPDDVTNCAANFRRDERLAPGKSAADRPQVRDAAAAAATATAPRPFTSGRSARRRRHRIRRRHRPRAGAQSTTRRHETRRRGNR